MVTLLEAQKTINATPYITCTVGGTELGQFMGRYKWYEKADSFGRAAFWFDNSGGRFNNLASGWPTIKRGKPVVLSRGLTVAGQNLSAAAPTFWVETIMFTLHKDTPYLVLDCIDWVGRLRYFRFDATQTYTNTQVSSIVSTLLSQVGLTLSGSITSLAIDYEIRPTRSAWSALRDLMAKVPQVLRSAPGGVVVALDLDSSDAADYAFSYNPAAGQGHPLLDDTDVAESSAVYNSITVVGGDDLEFSGTAENSNEIALMGYRRRRYITDRRLQSDAECEQRAEAEIEFWNARSTAGVIVARPHFTARLFDVVSAPAPLWGGPAVGSGHVTKITEWYNYASRKYDQALALGEVPDAAILHILDPDDEEPIPIDDDDPGDAGGGSDSGDTSLPPELEILTTGDTEVVIAGDLGLGAGNVAPLGLLHGYDTVSGFLHWEHAAVAATAQEIIPDGDGDVTAFMSVTYVIQASGGVAPDDVQGGIFTLGPGSNNDLYDDADGTCNFRINADGSVDVRRTAGTSTFKVAFWLLWI